MFLQLLLFLGAGISSTFAQATEEHLDAEILPICFERPILHNGELYINGQTEPLANSIENFLSLVEKLELVNPDLQLQDVLFILLRNYTADNVYYQASDLTPPFYGSLNIWTPTPLAMTVFESLWEPNKDKELPFHIDPFEKNEKCSLFFMLSHTVNETSRPNLDQKSYVPSAEGVKFSPGLMKTYFPREQGVVAVNNSRTHAVALGRVLLGLYVGLKVESERIKPVDSYGNQLKKNYLNGIKDVDILYLVTLADQLIISHYPIKEQTKARLGRNGFWKSVQLLTEPKTNGIPVCPTVYELPENETSAYTYSSMRGGIDGLILGDVIRDIHNNQPNVKLTQILRMYYGRNGLQEPTDAPPSHEIISFCNRVDKMASKEDMLKDQMKVFHAFVSKAPVVDNILSSAYNDYINLKRDIFTLDSTFENSCKALSDSKGIPQCEAAIDVIFVMDTTQKNVVSDIKNQKTIIGHLANHLEMLEGGSTLTVFSDQRNGASGLDLVTVINTTTSSACAACSAMRYEIDNGIPQAEKIIVVQSISETLRKLGEEEKALNGAKGKVVIFFNFEDEETVSSRLRRALRDLFMKHAGVQFFAIGNNKDVLKTYAQGQTQNVITVLDLQPDEIADTLAKKICEVPSKLQYDDCKIRRNEAGAVFEGLISPNSIQRWAMHPKYFFKSITPKMFFTTDSSESKQIKVCQSRAYSRAEDQEGHCRKTSLQERRIEFNTTNPCQGFNEHNCSPWYFTVSVADETSVENTRSSIQYCKDTDTVKCKTLDQVKFRVSHEGIRCSSGSRVFSTKDLLLACLSAYIVMKFWNSNK